MTQLTLVIDQGTHATRALAFDATGQIRASAYRKIALHGAGTAEVEQDAEEIAGSMDEVVDAVLADATVRRLGVACTGLTTQRSTVVAWDRRTGAPLAPALSWQDRRIAGWLGEFDAHAEAIKRRTGLRLTPHYGGGKLRWYLDNVPAVTQAHHEGYLAFGPLAAFLVFRLLKGNPSLVDHANAQRTQLWNLGTREWDPWLLDLYGVPAEPLPACRPTCHEYGRLRAADIPLTAVNGDQNAAIYSLGQPAEDTAIVNIGTGAFILNLTGDNVVQHSELLSGLAGSDENRGEYLIEGTVNGAGAALEWASDEWQVPDIKENLDAWLAHAGEIPLFVNTIGGLGSPWWRSGPAPTVLGDGEPWQKVVAVAESIVFLLQANLDAMVEAGLTVNRVQASGGLAQSDGLCRRLADLTQRPVYRPVETEATARGIAWLAAGSPAHWPELGRGQTFSPQPNRALAARYEQFRQVLEE